MPNVSRVSHDGILTSRWTTKLTFCHWWTECWATKLPTSTWFVRISSFFSILIIIMREEIGTRQEMRDLPNEHRCLRWNSKTQWNSPIRKWAWRRAIGAGFGKWTPQMFWGSGTYNVYLINVVMLETPVEFWETISKDFSYRTLAKVSRVFKWTIGKMHNRQI